ncbi:MAG: hypothetical protein R3B68_11810 [Phycisphaerales bacterium]
MAAAPMPIRVYADTSVFGGCFDEGFIDHSRAFFADVRSGRFRLVTSAVVEQELILAPPHVRRLFDEMADVADRRPVSGEAIRLQQAYLDAGVVGAGQMADALHVAVATASVCPIIVSWNFKHIVRFDKIPRYNAVNVQQGFGPILIHSPSEVSGGQEE